MIGPWYVKQVSDIVNYQNLSSATTNDRVRRGKIPIAIIDDEPFVAQQTLTNHGYDIRTIGDIKNLNEIDDFNIILCDLRGVGQYLNKKNQGAYIIDEIKRNHPEKFVIAYTGGTQDDNVAQKANRAADVFLRKDADIEEWRDKLDDFIDRLCDPVIVWRRQRDALVKHNVSTLDILKIEDAFVSSINKKDENMFSKQIDGYNIGSDARAIVNSLIASGILQLIIK